MRGLADASGDETGGSAVEETRTGGLGGERRGREDLDIARRGGVDDADRAPREGAKASDDRDWAADSEFVEGDGRDVGGAGAAGGFSSTQDGRWEWR